MKEPFLHEISVQTTRLKVPSKIAPTTQALCPKRILIGNGAIRRIVESSPSAVRHALQNGESLPENPSWIEEELYASI